MATADLIERPPISHDEIVAALSHPDALWEIEYGRVVEKTVSAFAIWIANKLTSMLDAEARRLNLGQAITEMVFILDRVRNLRRRPDSAFVSSKRWALDRTLPFRDDWAVVPNIAVEVVSPSNRADRLAKKRREYFRYGVEEVWVIYPEERIVEVHDPAGSRVFTHEQRLTSRLLPGIELDLATLLPVVDEVSET
jgi:Uma2 family endonuclease